MEVYWEIILGTGGAVINCVNFGNVEGESVLGGIVGLANINDGKSKIINSYNSGNVLGTKDIGEVLGKKETTGKYYIINSFGLDNGKSAYNIRSNDNDLEVTNCSLYTQEYMKTKEFLKTLDDYVTEYNKGEKEESGSKELLQWTFDDKTGYPTLIW